MVAEADLIAVITEAGKVLEFGVVTEQFRGECQAQRPGHLRGGWRQWGGNLFPVDQVKPFSVFVYDGSGEMGIHFPARAVGLVGSIRVGIYLGEEFFHGGLPGGKSDGLVAVIAREKVARLEKLGCSHLGHLLAIAENAKLGLAGKHFLATQQAGFPAFTANPVVLKHFLAKSVERQFAGFR